MTSFERFVVWMIAAMALSVVFNHTEPGSADRLPVFWSMLLCFCTSIGWFIWHMAAPPHQQGWPYK